MSGLAPSQRESMMTTPHQELEQILYRWTDRFRKGAQRLFEEKPLRTRKRKIFFSSSRPSTIHHFALELVLSFADCVSILPPLSRYYEKMAELESKYLHCTDQFRPLSQSYFTCWSLFDYRVGEDGETLGMALLHFEDIFSFDPEIWDAVRHLQDSRMGIYEHQGYKGKKVLLCEVLTGEKKVVEIPWRYRGQPGEIWMLRLVPNEQNPERESFAFTRPYVSRTWIREEWTAYLQEAIEHVPGTNRKERYHDLMKYGLTLEHWHEFYFRSFDRMHRDVVFLKGKPSKIAQKGTQNDRKRYSEGL